MRALLAAVLVSTSSIAAVAPPKAPPQPDPLVTAAVDAVAKSDLAGLVAMVEKELKPAVADVNALDPARVARLASLRELGRYFSRIEKLEGDSAEAVQWLAQQTNLSQTLMLAIGPADAPDRVLQVLAALRREPGLKLDEYANLAAAMCVVLDSGGGDDEPVPTDRPRMLMRYYTQGGGKLRFDPRSLPWPLAVYIADNRVGAEEIVWAVRRYANHGAIGAVYFDVPYDTGAFYGMTQRRIAGRDYTLMNLMQYGGICGDQAYYATMVARSLGVPAAICGGVGASATSVGHAWVAYLDSRGSSVEWNFREGRYAEHLYWRGVTVDPQTRQQITEAELALLAELQHSSARDRLGSEALLKSIDLMPEDKRPAAMMKAVNLSPGNVRAWRALADLAAGRRLSQQQVQEFQDVVRRFAVRRYPDFAFDMLRRAVSGASTAQQLAALDDMRKLFKSRPDLMARIALEKGDLLLDDKRPADALAAYSDVLRQYAQYGPIILEAMDHIEPMLRQAGDLARLAAIYKATFQRLPQPEVNAGLHGTAYYILGSRYRTLMDELGRKTEADQVHARLKALDEAAARRQR